MKIVALVCCLVLSLLAGSLPVASSPVDALPDPMKPPALALQKMKPVKAVVQTRNIREKEELKPLPRLVLQSIIFSSSRKIAVINDMTVVTGDLVEGARVIAIDRDRVTLLRRGNRLELMLDSDSRAINKTISGSDL